MLPYDTATVVLTVGFERTFTTAYEDIGTLELCVQIDTTDIVLDSDTHIHFSLSLDSVAGTAGAIMNEKHY